MAGCFAAALLLAFALQALGGFGVPAFGLHPHVFGFRGLRFLGLNSMGGFRLQGFGV